MADDGLAEIGLRRGPPEQRIRRLRWGWETRYCGLARWARRSHDLPTRTNHAKRLSIIATVRIPPAGRCRPAGPEADQDRRAAAKRRLPSPSSAAVDAPRGLRRAKCA